MNLSNGMNLLFGESGSGKSTLIDILTGFVKSPGYSWIINDLNLAELSLKDKKIGLVLQGGQVFPHLTGAQCLKFAAESRGVPEDKYQNKLAHFLEQLNISKKVLSQKTTTLSGGERQRLALMCALIGEPKVLLLDEPFSALDKKNLEAAFNLLTQFSENHKVPVLLISHNEDLRSKIKSHVQLELGQIVT